MELDDEGLGLVDPLELALDGEVELKLEEKALELDIMLLELAAWAELDLDDEALGLVGPPELEVALELDSDVGLRLEDLTLELEAVLLELAT